MTIHSMDSVLMLTVTACAIMDIFRDRIPNELTYAALISALIIDGMGFGAPGLGGEPTTLSQGFMGAMLAFVPFFVMYLAGGMGGGDVKLMTAVGAFKGHLFAGYAMLYALLFGTVLGLGTAAVHGQLGSVFRRLARIVLGSLLPAEQENGPEPMKGPHINFGVAICLGTLVAMAGQALGRQLLDL